MAGTLHIRLGSERVDERASVNCAVRYDTIRDAILTCARKPTLVRPRVDTSETSGVVTVAGFKCVEALGRIIIRGQSGGVLAWLSVWSKVQTTL